MQASVVNKAWRSGSRASATTLVEAEAHSARVAPSFWLPLVVLALVFGVVVTLTLVLLWLRPAKGTGLILVGAGYEDNLAVPHNVYGVTGLARIGELARKRYDERGARVEQLNLHHEQLQLVNISDWDKGLKTVREKTVILFLSLQGGVDRDGAYLLPQRALLPSDPGSLKDDQSRLRLSKLIDRLAEEKGRQIVLVLDVTQVRSNWSQGVLYNAFAHELDKLEQRLLDLPNLVVLSASDVDQLSWPAEELRSTIFAHYVLRGLAGDADTDRDHRLNALELSTYVSRQVENWSLQNRAVLQTPVLRPRGKVGEDRARAMKLAVVRRYVEPQPERIIGFTPPAELVQAWERCQELSEQAPTPAVYAPAQWRLYLDTLRRYEQLLEAGATDAARRLHTRLGTLEQDIQRAQRLPLDALQNTLAMHLATGTPLPSSPAIGEALSALWNTKMSEVTKKWDEVRQRLASTGDKTALTLLRVKLSELILQRTADDPAVPLDRAYQLLKLLDDPLSPQPAEAHFALLLQRDVPRQPHPDGPSAAAPLPPVDLLQLALRVRLLAERAALGAPSVRTTARAWYAYSEQVHAWIRPAVEEADQQRRLGQDLLFTVDKASWDRAREQLQLAERGYQRAAEDSARIQDALTLRDQIMPQLPYYAHWIARRQGLGDAQRKAADRELCAYVEDLAAQCHELNALLEAPFARPGKSEPGTSVPGVSAPPAQAPAPGTDVPGSSVPAADKTLVLDIERKVELLRRMFVGFENQTKALRGQLELLENPLVWRDLDDALQAPLTDGKTRLELLSKRSRIGGRLLVDSQRPQTPAPLAASVYLDQVRERARAEGRLALALLGQRWFDSCGGDVRETFEQVSYRLSTLPVEDKWRESLVAVGVETQQRWRRLAPQVAGLTAPDRKASADENLVVLREADRLTRLLQGPEALFLKQSAAVEYRALLAQRLLLWQAERTYQDHLFAEDASREPYFKAAGQVFLDDARKLAARQPQLKILEDKLRRAGRLQLLLHSAPGYTPEILAKLPKTPPLHLTSENEYPLQFRLQAADSAQAPPTGYPVVWMDAGSDLKFLATQDVPRQARLFTAGSNAVFSTAVRSPSLEAARAGAVEPKSSEATMSVHGLFRGQHLELKTALQMHPLAEMTHVRHPLPILSSVAVRAPRYLQDQLGSSGGSIAIVLDCSGSMGPQPGQPFDERTKYAEACAALRAMLPHVPRGTTLSLWAFGQAVGELRTVAAAEESIRRILPPTRWNPDDAAQLQDLMAKISYPALRPWNETPLVRTMLHAAREDLASATGFKTLIAITDGMDNRIQKDREFNPANKDIETLLREQIRDVEVNVIGYKVVSQEQAKAREQLECVKDLPLPGRYVEIGDSQALVGALKGAFRQKLRYWIDREDNRPVAGTHSDGLDISFTGSNDHWLPGGLPPGGYKVRVHANQRVVRSIALNPADLLLLELGPQNGPGAPPGSLGFHRVLFAETEFAFKPRQLKGDWLLALLQNQRLTSKGAQLTLTLERKHDPLVSALQQLRPTMAWIEVATPSDAPAPFAQRLSFLPGYPAPAWGIDIPQWPSRPGLAGAPAGSGPPAKTIVKAWLSPDLEPRGVKLERGHHYVHLDELSNRSVVVDEQEAVLESVRVEEHAVEERPGQLADGKLEKKSCLVVRLRHAAQQPVLVRLRGLQAAGHEQRLYTTANKVTAIFWPVTAAQAGEVLRGLEVFSLSAFKQKAVEDNYYFEMSDLYEPRPGETRPLSPVDLSVLSARKLGIDSGEWLRPLDRQVQEREFLLPRPPALGIPTLDEPPQPLQIPGIPPPPRIEPLPRNAP